MSGEGMGGGSAAELGLKGQRVLVVDDDPDFRTIITKSLQRRGLVTSQVDTVDAALAACTAQPPDLILMDVWMPGHTGIEGCRLLRKHAPSAVVPIILMSGQWRDEAQLDRALRAGADDVMAKEMSGVELIARVRACLCYGAVRAKLGQAEAELAEMRELLAICASCKEIRNEDGSWEGVERYIERTGDVDLTHSICPTCREKLYGEGHEQAHELDAPSQAQYDSPSPEPTLAPNKSASDAA